MRALADDKKLTVLSCVYFQGQIYDTFVLMKSPCGSEMYYYTVITRKYYNNNDTIYLFIYTVELSLYFSYFFFYNLHNTLVVDHIVLFQLSRSKVMNLNIQGFCHIWSDKALLTSMLQMETFFYTSQSFCASLINRLINRGNNQIHGLLITFVL